MLNRFLCIPDKQRAKFEIPEIFKVQFFIRCVQRQQYLDPLFFFSLCVKTSFNGYCIDFLTRPLSILVIALNHAANTESRLSQIFLAFHTESVELNGDLQRSLHIGRTLSHGTLLRLYR